MKFKLDENFGVRTSRIFNANGHDVHTVREQSLEGASDQQLYRVCCEEQRCLVTLDLDFSDVTRFDPPQSGGIAVIRIPRNPNLSTLEQMIRQFLRALEDSSIEKKLWIVEFGRIRVHHSDEDN